ncbi:MAG: phosphopantetheine-binding protein [Pseudomonadota bacterium]
MTDVQAKVFDIVAKEARLDRSQLSLDDKLEDLNIESLDMVQILFGIEDEFDVYVPQEDDSFRLDSLGDVVNGVKQLIADKETQSANAS